jgi:hypothetical protein
LTVFEKKKNCLIVWSGESPGAVAEVFGWPEAGITASGPIRNEVKGD